MRAFTREHFLAYAGRLVFDDGETRDPEDWQLEIAEDIFAGYPEIWSILPEGNGKSTFMAELALYGADFTRSPWIPVGAASAKQARIVYDQAAGFVERTPGLDERFACFGGYKVIRSKENGGTGIEVFAAEQATGDGVIPFPYAIIDELHRHRDLGLYRLWKGKLRKRGAQILTISTAGEPETPFEVTRDEIRRKATNRRRSGSHLRAEGEGLVLHEWMVQSEDDCVDMAAVKEANPLSTITEPDLREDFDSPTTDLGTWKRLKCNRPTRSLRTAITDKEYDDAKGPDALPDACPVEVGVDVAWKWDTFAIVPQHVSGFVKVKVKTKEGRDELRELPQRLWGPPKILVPPRDGSAIHPDVVKEAFMDLNEWHPIDTAVMDMGRAEDIAAWLEDDLGIRVIDRAQTNALAVEDYEAVMTGLRTGTLKHTGDPDLRMHALRAIARRLPGGDFRFDRPSQSRNAADQDVRVIDALTAAAMVAQHALRSRPKRSVYEDRYATV